MSVRMRFTCPSSDCDEPISTTSVLGGSVSRACWKNTGLTMLRAW